MNSSQVKGYLLEWDKSVSAEYTGTSIKSSARRDFLKTLLTGSAAVVFSESVLANTKKLNGTIWETLSAVHLHMFPKTKNEPDAISINATAYLKSVLEWPGIDEEDKKFITDGVGWLNGLSEKTFNMKFQSLNQQDKEMVLRTVEKSQAGENWLSLIMLYLIESLLTDPAYGGNKDSQGWRWLEHQPGFPRPSADKRYFNL